MLILRLLVPLFRSAGRTLKRLFSAQPQRSDADAKKRKYSELTPYEIEDADYEEISNKQGGAK